MLGEDGKIPLAQRAWVRLPAEGVLLQPDAGGLELLWPVAPEYWFSDWTW